METCFRSKIGPGLALIIEAVVLFAIYAVLLMGAAAAPAAGPTRPWHAETDWRVRPAQMVASKVWHAPCGGNVTVRTSDAEILAPLYPGATAVAEQTGPCEITFAPSYDRLPWGLLCTVMIHEWGHLAGYRDPRNVEDPFHSLNPRSVMAPDAGIGSANRPHYDRRCAHLGLPYLRSPE